ncbi:MAG: MBL fold metallo-hydrolase [Chloroflexi bacterium]|nr:MBL fold metallo-hydrolase [Chloroflexota bacterium]
MKIRVVGAHNFASRDHLLATILVDDRLALDAGSLSAGLTFEEQARVEAVLITHRHFDHIRDLLTFGLAASYGGQSVEVCGIAPTIDGIREQFFTGALYPDPTRRPSLERPAVRLRVLEPNEPARVAGYTVVARPVPHAVEACGYEIVDAVGKSIFYSGDAAQGVEKAWPNIRPQLLLLECTFSNADEERAVASGHLIPRTFEDALLKFREVNGYIPKAVAVHLNPFSEAALRRELEAAVKSRGIDIQIAIEGLALEI